MGILELIILALLATFAFGQDPVKISLYYESLCPYSENFIANQLDPTYKLVPDIIAAEAFPYGNAYQIPDGDSWTFQCQHGPEECTGNLIDSCALYYYPDQSQWIPYLGCSEGAEPDPVNAKQQCAINQGMDWDLISNCSNSDFGRELEHENGDRTESLVPTQTHTPWILFNDVHNDTLELYAQIDLLDVVCSLYKGTPPEACST